MDIYQRLRKHFDVMPVAFPETDSGIEIDILRRFFTEEEAEVAFQLSMLPERAERIYRRVIRASHAPRFSRLFRLTGVARLNRLQRSNRAAGTERNSSSDIPLKRVREILERLDEKKVVNTSTVRRRGGTEKVYGKLPFAVGLYEFQVDRLTRDFEAEASVYMDEAFMESFTDESPRQMRTIPINETILPDRNISRYDSIRNVILESPGPFVVQNCICRQGKELLGESCKQTDLKETCLALGPAALSAMKEGRGTRMTREETLAFLERAESEGLVLQAQNTRNPIFICCCCSCCCQILSRVKKLPNPGTILKSNYYATADPQTCLGCGICIPRCPMDAIELVSKSGRAGKAGQAGQAGKTGQEAPVGGAGIDISGRRHRTASINPERCIGCGLCFSVCPAGALSMQSKQRAKDPPRTAMAMYIKMFFGRFGPIKGGFLLLKAGLGFRV